MAADWEIYGGDMGRGLSKAATLDVQLQARRGELQGCDFLMQGGHVLMPVYAVSLAPPTHMRFGVIANGRGVRRDVPRWLTIDELWPLVLEAADELRKGDVCPN